MSDNTEIPKNPYADYRGNIIMHTDEVLIEMFKTIELPPTPKEFASVGLNAEVDFNREGVVGFRNDGVYLNLEGPAVEVEVGRYRVLHRGPATVSYYDQDGRPNTASCGPDFPVTIVLKMGNSKGARMFYAWLDHKEG